jgi:HK97 family phage major capsid protein/HK97 family phage prohead protease
MKKIQLNKKQFREIGVLDVKSMDKDQRTIEISFSSEVPYERYYGFEIISHAQGAINLDRLSKGAPLLFNHNMDDQIGIVEKAWVGSDRRGYATVRFGNSQLAQEKFQDVQDGILKNVSFGYMIDEMILSKKSDGASPDEYTVTKCTPYEVSMVTVPADYSVGVGRDGSDEQIDVTVQTEEEAPSEGVEAPAENQKNDIESNLTADQNEAARKVIKMDEIQKAQEAAKKTEKERQAAINALGTKFNKPELARQLIEGDKSVEESRAAFLDVIGEKQKPVTGNEGVIGLNEKEIKQFSFVRALNALANPTDRKAQEMAKFEIEVGRAASEKSGRSARGIMIPVDVLRAATRELVVATPSAGGNTVATDLLGGSFIEILRNKMALQAAGIQVLNGLVGNIAIPRQTGAASAAWVAESGPASESTQSIDQVTMSPKTLAAFSKYSRKLLLQSSIDVESFVRNDLAAVMALEIDRAGLYGLGSANQPEGVKETTGINTENFDAATPDFSEIVSMETKVQLANADIAAMKYITNATIAGALKTKEKASGYPVYVLENGEANGYPVIVSNQVASGDVFFGVWNQLILGMWSGLDLMVDPYADALAGGVRVIAHQDCDFAVRHPESFTRGNDTL